VLQPHPPIVHVEVLNPAIDLESLDDKNIVLDLRARFQDGTTANIEMQSRPVSAFRERLLYYWARLFGSQLGPGDGYTTLRPTISIAFLRHREPHNPRFHSVFRILETRDHTPYGNALSIHLVQLPRLAELGEADRASEAALLRWSRFFAARTAEELDEAAMNDPAVSKARDILLHLSADADVRRRAEERELAQITRRIEDGALREEAEAVGEERGVRIGEERGVRIGEERGLRVAIHALCAGAGIAVDEARAASIDAMDLEALRSLIERLGATRTWP
jgi:predicted transposase/invertase (TIGR01784 family)